MGTVRPRFSAQKVYWDKIPGLISHLHSQDTVSPRESFLQKVHLWLKKIDRAVSIPLLSSLEVSDDGKKEAVVKVC
ncbi:hypothetical protein HOLleu_24863 [Holothuria leucospilota]|uniref:Uncharacterized protein n=1 Tax=Holothuria leucospilota TaxID=206669 RepID=A0A9Q1BRS9_HOLLE|nr:hypothetical protein HOLleu_24863 [Holothuria leucospilota]